MTVELELPRWQTVSVASWTRSELKLVSDHFEGRRPEEILQWGIDSFAPGLALATGFGAEGVTLMHMVSQLAPETTVFYLDTELLFPETYELRDQLAERLGLTFTRVATRLTLDEQARQYGDALWARDPNQCCHLRKVQPLREYLLFKDAWITAIRRDQTTARAKAGLVEWDSANGLVKLNPLAGWTKADVWAYLHIHELPYNRLHDRGYKSIGCWPCTRAVAPGEDDRAGRWSGFGKTECGIHLKPPETAGR
jgi:phosphoadenosine phosphosulfate reductase